MEPSVVFKTARHWTPLWARLIHSTPFNPVSIRPFILLFSHLCLGLARDLLLSDFLTKTLYARGGRWLRTCALRSHSSMCAVHPLTVNEFSSMYLRSWQLAAACRTANFASLSPNVCDTELGSFVTNFVYQASSQVQPSVGRYALSKWGSSAVHLKSLLTYTQAQSCARNAKTNEERSTSIVGMGWGISLNNNPLLDFMHKVNPTQQ